MWSVLDVKIECAVGTFRKAELQPSSMPRYAGLTRHVRKRQPCRGALKELQAKAIQSQADRIVSRLKFEGAKNKARFVAGSVRRREHSRLRSRN